MKLPNGPRTPAIIQTIQSFARPFEFVEACAQRYGDIFTARFSGYPPSYVVLGSPQAIQELFTADPKLFDVGEGNRNLEFLLGAYSLILLDGDRHQRQRRLLMPPFHGERMRAYGSLICDITERVISQWQINQPFSAYSAMQEISLRVILRAVFGLDQGERFQKLRQLISSLLNAFESLSAGLLVIPFLQVDLGPWSPWGRFLRRRQQINHLLDAEIQKRRANPDSSGEDILSLIMSAHDEAGQPMTDGELRDELITLLFAGHESTASALAWALYWIHHLPEIHDRLQQELHSLSPNPGEVARLPYLNAVCQETLRIYPVAQFTFSRIVKSPFQLMGYEFEPGTVLAPCIHLVHHREDLYPEPKRFKPERFLERQFSPYEYLPFGGSNRRCIGMAFAQFEMKLVLATILSHLQLALTDNRSLRPVSHSIILKPSGKVQMVPISQRRLTKTLVQL